MPARQPDPDSYAEQRALFAEARRLRPEDRETYVRSRASSAAVAMEVLDLLAADATFDDTAAEPEQPMPKSGRVQSTGTGTLLAKLDGAPRFDAERFRIERELGRGGMGVVWRIHDLFLNRRLAMKVLLERRLPDTPEGQKVGQQLLGRFLAEAQVTSQLDHPGVVPLHELGLDADGKVYFTMRMVKGRTARQVFEDAFAERGEWNLTRALEVVLKVCDTMAYAHDKGVLHRDLKPENVMVGRFGEVYVMDWGLAKMLGEPDLHDLRIRAEEGHEPTRSPSSRLDARRTSPTSVVSMDGQQLGTPSYMSPEQVRGQDLDASADVYSIGAMLYELVTGRAPYTDPATPRSPYRILDAVDAGPPPPIASLEKDVPAELIAVVDKAMARERSERYATVQQLASDLRSFLAHRAVSAYRTDAWQEAKLWLRRNKPLAASLAAAVLLLVTAIGILAVRPDSGAAATAASLAEFELLALVDEHRQLLAEAATLRQREAGSEVARAAWLPRATALLAREDELRRASTAARRQADDAATASSARGAKRVLAATLGELLQRLPELTKLVEELRSGR